VKQALNFSMDDRQGSLLSNIQNRWLMAIDTSTEQASIGLFDGHQLSEMTWPAGRDQTVSLLDQIDHLLTLSKLSVADVNAVGIAIGPGMFSGLRVGMSIAKGFALTANIPVIGILTLDAVAMPHQACSLPVFAVLAAGRGRLLWGPYVDGQGEEPRNGTAEELLAEVDANGVDALICGEMTTAQRAILDSSPRIHMPPSVIGASRASAVAALAWRRFENGEFDDAVTLEPVYLHAASPRSTGGA
jgi:tRNA threonylcarbamoyladenosine biosynthesis protein TsaB